jgi:hypothetical protein
MLQGPAVNVSEFLHTKTNCPFCNEKLVIRFRENKSIIKYIDNRLVAILDMKSLKRNQKNYKIGYSFSIEDNSFHIEFFDSTGNIINNVISTSLLAKFMELHRNLLFRHFSKKCNICKKYSLMSNDIVFDFNTQTISDLEVECEEFIFVTPADDQYKIVVMCNFYYPNQLSIIHFWRDVYDNNPNDRSTLTLPLIPFVSSKETLARLNGLLIFS